MSSASHPLTSLVDRAAPITGNELYHLPDLGPCELVEGHVRSVRPTSWQHGKLVTDLAEPLRAFVESRERGLVMSGDIGIYTARDPDTVRGADVTVLSNTRRSRIQSERFLDVAPERIAEVHPPDYPEEAFEEKIKEYFTIGVKQIWLLDPDQECLRRYRTPTHAERLDRTDSLHGEGVLEGLQLPLSKVFGTN